MRVHLKQQGFADSGTRELVISDLSAVAFEVALDFVYKGKATLKDDTRLQSVLEAASRLEIAPLLEAASAAIQHRLTCANSVDIWNLAERYSLPMLCTAARRMCLRRFEALVENPSFLGLSRERLLALVGDDELSVKSERIVFEAVLQWARHHGAASDGQLAELLAPVRFGFMPREQLQYVLSEPLVKASPTVLIDVASALADKHDATPQMARSSPRRGCQLIYLIGFSSKDYPVYDRLCKRFDPVTSAVTSIAPLPEDHDAVSAAALDGNIYVVASIVTNLRGSEQEWRCCATTRPRMNGAHSLPRRRITAKQGRVPLLWIARSTWLEVATRQSLTLRHTTRRPTLGNRSRL